MTRVFAFILSALLATSATAEECFPFCDTSVWKSAKCGTLCNFGFWETADINDVRAEIDAGASLNAHNDGGWGPLHYAAYLGTTDSVIAMLDAGARVEGFQTETPLQVAIARKQSVFSYWLRDQYFSGPSRALYQDNPYLGVGYYGANFDIPSADINAIAALIDAGSNVNFVTEGGRAALSSAAAFQDVEFVELLLAAGAVVNIADEKGVTPLHMSVGRDASAITERLLAAGADLTAATIEHGTTPIHRANYENLKLLLEHGADINIRDADGQMPLHTSMAFKDLDVVQLLVEEGADFEIGDDMGRTPIHLLVELSEDIDKLAFAIEKGADIEATDALGNTPLHLAALTENFAMVTTLLAAGVNVDVKNADGETPLFLAATLGYPNRFNLYVRDSWIGKTTDVIEALLNAGADIDATNNRGATALFTILPRENFFLQTIDFLREQGAATDFSEYLISREPSEQYIMETRGATRTRVKINPRTDYCYVLLRRRSELEEREVPCPEE